jgi:hypothetical protein
MNDIDALLAELESRGMRVTLHPNGKLTVGPPGKVTGSDRADLAHHREGILRRLQERTPPTPELSVDDAPDGPETGRDP